LRHRALQYTLKQKLLTILTEKELRAILGKPKYSNDKYKKINPPGVVVGLAWTYVGGEILFIESLLSKGKGGLKLTGNLGKVMQESAQAAYTFLNVYASDYGIDIQKLENSIHIHVPEGATPKDGPSAGITMLTAICSILLNKKVKPYVAMTGEITLRGELLPVGGIKEKVLAAKRAGLKEIILSKLNEKDVNEIESEFIQGLQFTYMNTMDSVLKYVLSL
ncbi:MAG: S16 family serine protease, partial [Chitinophagaceae bacterium]